MAVWMMFTAPCPTPSGKTAEQMVLERETGISPEMQASARELGCTFHRCWSTADGAMFVAVACWQTRDGARTFFDRWSIASEEGEVAVQLVGDCGLVPLG